MNQKLPRGIRLNGEYRGRLEGVSGFFFSDNDDVFWLNRLRINLSLLPTNWLKFQFQAQDSQAFGRNIKPDAPPYEDTMDLRVGYVELLDPETKPFGIRVGRQELAFGDQRLVGPSGWLNTPRTFDAVKATFRHKAYRMDLFASSVVVVQDGTFPNRHVDASNFHGAYGAMTGLIPNATVEPYGLWRVARRTPLETGGLGNLDAKTAGLHWAGKLPPRVDYDIEMAGQLGELGPEDVSAWAGHWLLGYTMTGTPWTPRLVLEYNFATGDDAVGDGERSTFDGLYPTAHDKWGFADQVGWRNIEHIRAAVEFKPHPKWLLVETYHSFWLQSPTDGLYNAGGALVVRRPDGSAGRHVGQELDLFAVYSPTPLMQISGGYSHLFPGTFLKNATPGHAYQLFHLMFSCLF